MSQFVLISGPQPKTELDSIRFRKVVPSSNRWPDCIASDMPDLGIVEDIWLFEDESSKSTDFIFYEAQKEIAEGKVFRDTRLWIVLSTVLVRADNIVLWYSNDWKDLPVIKEFKEFLELVERDLMIGSGEIYLHYLRK